MRMRSFLILAAAAAGSLFGQDPPSRVARLNWINGGVSFQPAGLDTWSAATPNYPLTTGDHIYTDVGSRAEMHVGPNAIRLNSETNFGFLNLDDRTVQMRFTQGVMEVRLRRLDDSDVYEVDTPNGAISLLRTGDYRIDTDPNRNATMITVFSGEVEVTANGNSFAIHPRQTAYFSDGAQPDVREANPPDDFDRFTGDRNMREDRVPPPVHVPPSMIGYEDLDANGSWRNMPDYGWVWAPRVEAGWAPYRNGHWAWVEPWGWTWIDDAPWGFAPFHYGRWAFAGGGWFWAPGVMVARPVYAPALVAFVGGPHFNIGIGIGGGGGLGAVAWFPLGPREPYYPAYHVSNTYVQQVNITHVTNVNVTNINTVNNIRYVNQQVPGAVTAVPQNTFVNARPVAAAAQRVNPQQLAQAQVVGTAPQVAPQRNSVMGSVSNRAVAVPPQAAMSRQVVARATPPPPPVSFQAKEQVLAQNQGRPLAPQQVMQLRQQQPAAVVNRVPYRSAAAPGPSPAPSMTPNAPRSAPAMNQPRGFPQGNVQGNPQGNPPVNRLDSRPPGARPIVPQNAPQNAPQTSQPQPQSRPEFARPVPENRPAPEYRPSPQVTPRPAPESRPAPQMTPPRAAPENRPAPEVAPRAVPERRPAPESARPEPQRAERTARPEPRREERKDEKK